jgi:hypothetical protein
MKPLKVGDRVRAKGLSWSRIDYTGEKGTVVPNGLMAEPGEVYVLMDCDKRRRYFQREQLTRLVRKEKESK